jgi:hypothetical protein
MKPICIALVTVTLTACASNYAKYYSPAPEATPESPRELSHLGLNGPMLQATQQLQIVLAQGWFSSKTFNVEN